ARDDAASEGQLIGRDHVLPAPGSLAPSPPSGLLGGPPRAVPLRGDQRPGVVTTLHATLVLSFAPAVGKPYEGKPHVRFDEGRWRRAVGLLDRHTRPKGEKPSGVAGPATVPRHCPLYASSTCST